MRALLHNPGAGPVLSGPPITGLELEQVSDTALRAAAARLGDSNLLPLVHCAHAPVAGSLALIRNLRSAGFTGAFLVLGRQLTPRERADLLNAGADDVAVAPIDGSELFARLAAISRRSHGIQSEAVQLGALEIFLDGRHPRMGEKSLQLSAREYQILRYLALNPERVVTKSAIYDALYALCPMPPFDKIIDVYICRLRAKLSKAVPQGASYIQTLPGRGYRLTAPTNAEIKGS